MKFPTSEGVGIVHGNRVKSRNMINTVLAGIEKRKMCNLVSRVEQNINPKNNHNPTLIKMFQVFVEEVISDINLDMDACKVDDLPTVGLAEDTVSVSVCDKNLKKC